MNVPSIVILIFVGAMVTAGVYLALERTLSRIFIGLSLVTNGINLLILAMGGAAGMPPLLGSAGQAIIDPLPQAMILTSIVLSLGTTAFGLALAYRSWLLTGNDEVADDTEDRRIARRLGRAGIDDSVAEGTEDATVFYDRGDIVDAIISSPRFSNQSDEDVPAPIRRLRRRRGIPLTGPFDTATTPESTDPPRTATDAESEPGGKT